MYLFKKRTGFTLLEILIVIAIISTLFSFILFTLNPGEKINRAYDIQRTSDINAMNKALQQYLIDYGKHPVFESGLDNNPKYICNTGFSVTNGNQNNCDGLVDLSILVPTYLVAIPTDPILILKSYNNNKEISLENGYTIAIMESNQILIGAPNMSSGKEVEQLSLKTDLRGIKENVLILLISVILIITLMTYLIFKNKEK